MWKIYLTKFGIIGSLALSVLHYTSHGVVSMEEFAKSRLEVHITRLELAIAKARGYQKAGPAPERWDEHDALVVAERFALEFQINPALVRATLRHESGKKQFAISPKGAIGYMQIMPDNYKRCGLKEPGELLDKVKNIRCGVQILAENIKAQRGDVEKGLWEYNGGPKAVPVLLKCGHNVECMSGYKETYFHSRDIINRMAKDVAA